ncbi:histone-lysine N-methyltransferase eggless [Aedes albopictus]|uniref:Histone-lysine N-methyltransferase eggless n=1 Tax=Aedes albopictus TaxID=7160 RepID=A0ABM1YG81_AEDAL
MENEPAVTSEAAVAGSGTSESDDKNESGLTANEGKDGDHPGRSNNDGHVDHPKAVEGKNQEDAVQQDKVELIVPEEGSAAIEATNPNEAEKSPPAETVCDDEVERSEPKKETEEDKASQKEKSVEQEGAVEELITGSKIASDDTKETSIVEEKEGTLEDPVTQPMDVTDDKAEEMLKIEEGEKMEVEECIPAEVASTDIDDEKPTNVAKQAEQHSPEITETGKQDDSLDVSKDVAEIAETDEKKAEKCNEPGEVEAVGTTSQKTDSPMIVDDAKVDIKERTVEETDEAIQPSEKVNSEDEKSKEQSAVKDYSKNEEATCVDTTEKSDENMKDDATSITISRGKAVDKTDADVTEGNEEKCEKSEETDKAEEASEMAITKEDESKEQIAIAGDSNIEKVKSADSIEECKEVVKDDINSITAPQEKADSVESPKQLEEVTEEEKKAPVEESNCMQKQTKTDDEKKPEEDDDIILIDDEKSTTDVEKGKLEESAEQEKIEPATKKLRLSTEEKEESKMDTTDQESKEADVNKDAEEPKSDLKTDEDKPKTDKVMSEDEDVVLVENDSKCENKVDEKEDEQADADKNKSEEVDVVVVVETSEADDDIPKADETKSPAKEDNSKDDSDVVMLVDSEAEDSKDPPNEKKVEVKEVAETNGDKKDEATKEDEKDIDKSEPTKTDEASKSEDKSDQTTETDKPTNGTPTKRFVLDENTGMFEEKETQPEETVPQVFGDSDEDVVMVDNYVTTDRKSASKPPSKVQQPSATASTTKAITTATAEQKTPTTAQEKKPADATAKEPPSKPKSSTVSVECINAECKKNTRESAPAPPFVLNFFGIPKKTKKQRVCLSCYDEVVEKYSILGAAVLDQQPLLFCEMPRKNELVEISDSSEEEEDADVKLEAEKPLPADIIALVESELNDIVSSTFEKINISQQVDWTEQIMKQKIAYNTKLSDEINNELNELQRKVDKIHLKLYSKSRPRYQDLPPINIFEMDANRQPVVQQPIQVNRQYSPQKPLNQTTQQQPHQQKQQTSQTTTMGTQASGASVSPPKEEFSRPAVSVGQFYFAVKNKLLSNWSECQVVEAVTVADKSLYKVNFLYNIGGGSAPIKVVPAKYLAYRHSFNVKLPLGTRVIARFDAGTTQPTLNKSQQAKSTSFYPGIIAESFGKYNRNRYLIFFDDGYAQYVTHGDVRVVCEESKEVWLDIHPHSQEFIKNYLMNYRSQRPMVQVKVGQRIITEWKGKWIYAKVIDIDASLVQLHFPDDNRYEWIYRGSTRLGPLYQEKALSMSKQSNKFSKFQKRNEPSIEYITLDDDDDESDQAKQQDAKKAITPQEQALQALKNLQMSQADSANRSVAKKSTFHRSTPASQPSAVFMNSSTIYCEDDRPKGKIVYYTAKKHLPPLKYKPHDCNPNCLFKITHNLKSYSPMAKPLLSGWERQLCKMRYKKVFVVYRAPCGRRVRNMYELHMYLRMTKATLNVENFDFDPMIHCLAEYVIENHIYHNPDLSDGKEFMAVPCVNYFDDTKPPPCIYSTERIPTEGVNLNLDSDFLCGCDCEDDCIDKSRCQCWQLTIAGAKFGNPNTQIDNIGYVYKRLQEPVVTGIYECNSRCKCKSNCLNRVVQHPLMTKLQVFKTSNRGWGIRCLNDVAKGSFICIYSGHLLTEEAGNTICEMNENKAGDEYFADLDYIETVEQLKEGYEADVVESESEADSDEPDYDAKQDSAASDDDFTASTNPTDAAVKTRSQVRRDSRSSTQKTESKTEKKSSKKKEDSKTGSDDEREMVNLIPYSDMTKEDAPSPAIKYRSVRKYFGKHEQIYIMDAKKSGNLGRYFNHSCNPNLFVQNVFVDTHDLRFPWVAFFALCNVRAGSELTWNYNYDVGSVPGKVLYCQCGAENCRQRLL